MLTKEQVDAIAKQVVADCNGGMRVVIGDRTPRQYDKADTMAGYINNAVKRALYKTGHTDKDYSYE